MKNAIPLTLVLVLAITAGVLSLSSKKPGLTGSSRSAEAELMSEQPALTDLPLPQINEPAKPPETTAAKGIAEPWPQASSDIPADAAATFGTLENGFRYIIYPNSEPPKRASLRLHIASGSLMERDDQQGLSHFLEHMVFNGSKDFAADALVPKMQRLGIAFGAHVNAYTSFDETVYMLDLPDLSADTVDLCYSVMRNFGDGALLATGEIDKERGVILSEKVSRDSVSTRLMEQQFAQILPGSLVGKRFPIGTEEVIKTATRDKFTDLYSRYYIPKRMTFVVVGDINAKETQAMIGKTFSSMTNPSDAGKNPDLGPIKQPEGIETGVFADKEITSTDLARRDSLLREKARYRRRAGQRHDSRHRSLDLRPTLRALGESRRFCDRGRLGF
jgi:zinc protease